MCPMRIDSSHRLCRTIPVGRRPAQLVAFPFDTHPEHAHRVGHRSARSCLVHFVAALSGSDVRQSGAAQQHVRRIGMIDRCEQTPLRLCFGDIDRISVQAPVHGSGECNAVRDRHLRQLVRTCNARDRPANTRRIARHDAPRAILVSELQQP